MQKRILELEEMKGVKVKPHVCKCVNEMKRLKNQNKQLREEVWSGEEKMGELMDTVVGLQKDLEMMKEAKELLEDKLRRIDLIA